MILKLIQGERRHSLKKWTTMMVLLLAGNKYFTLYLVGDLDPLPESFSSVILRQHESGGILYL